MSDIPLLSVLAAHVLPHSDHTPQAHPAPTQTEAHDNPPSQPRGMTINVFGPPRLSHGTIKSINDVVYSSTGLTAGCFYAALLGTGPFGFTLLAGIGAGGGLLVSNIVSDGDVDLDTAGTLAADVAMMPRLETLKDLVSPQAMSQLLSNWPEVAPRVAAAAAGFVYGHYFAADTVTWWMFFTQEIKASLLGSGIGNLVDFAIQSYRSHNWRFDRLGNLESAWSNGKAGLTGGLVGAKYAIIARRQQKLRDIPSALTSEPANTVKLESAAASQRTAFAEKYAQLHKGLVDAEKRLQALKIQPTTPGPPEGLAELMRDHQRLRCDVSQLRANDLSYLSATVEMRTRSEKLQTELLEFTEAIFKAKQAN